jgi:hypothetical protein
MGIFSSREGASEKIQADRLCFFRSCPRYRYRSGRWDSVLLLRISPIPLRLQRLLELSCHYRISWS